MMLVAAEYHCLLLTSNAKYFDHQTSFETWLLKESNKEIGIMNKVYLKSYRCWNIAALVNWVRIFFLDFLGTSLVGNYYQQCMWPEKFYQVDRKEWWLQYWQCCLIFKNFHTKNRLDLALKISVSSSFCQNKISEETGVYIICIYWRRIISVP